MTAPVPRELCVICLEPPPEGQRLTPRNICPACNTRNWMHWLKAS